MTRLMIDIGGRVLSAALALDDGQIIPISQEIRNTATRYVSTEILFEPRVPEHRDFTWDDSLESLGKASARDFFQRARRIGLRRPWDPQLSTDVVSITPPLSVLSSPAAIADTHAQHWLPRFAIAMIDALLDPIFGFVAERRIAAERVDVVVIIPSYASRIARRGITRLVRHRGFRSVLLLRREIAAAMTFLENSGVCDVADSTHDDLQIHRVALYRDDERMTFKTVHSSLHKDLGWHHWASRIASAIGTTPAPAFDRALLSALSGSPSSTPLPHSTIDRALAQSQLDDDLGNALRGDASSVYIGELASVDAIRERIRGIAVTRTSEEILRAVAATMQWRDHRDTRRICVAPRGTLRLDTLHGNTIELLRPGQLPAPGESCVIQQELRITGEQAPLNSVLVHLLWGGNSTIEGNATISAMRVPLHGSSGERLRLAIRLHRSRGGALLHGFIEAHSSRGGIPVHARFTEDLEVTR